MGRRPKIKEDEFLYGCLMLIAIIILIAVIIWYKGLSQNEKYLFWISAIIIVSAIIFFSVKIHQNKKQKEIAKFKVIQISNIDYMNGYEFENYVLKLLSFRGYYVQATRLSNDYGVDLIAKKVV